MKKTKVLFLIFSLERGGGAERVIVDQINRLDHALFECSLCLLHASTDHALFDELALPAANKKIINFSSLFDFRSWRALVSWFRREHFDVVYSHLFFANFVGRVAGKLAGVSRLFATEHNVYLNRGFFERTVNRVLAHMSTRVIAVSESVKAYLVEYEHINPAKVAVVYNGVDTGAYLFSPERRVRQRSAWNLSPDEFAVVSIGQVNPQKNYELLIDIAHEVVVVRGEAMKFFILGSAEGSLAAALQHKAEQLKLSGVVHFEGRSDDVPACLSAADAFAMTSRWEGFGLALVEAMGNGKPVVVNNISTLKEIVGAAGEYGFIAHDVKTFADALIKLKHDKTLRDTYRDISVRRAADFTIEANVRTISNLLHTS